jgi:sodium/potassium-transporting ATPase subunit alpha
MHVTSAAIANRLIPVPIPDSHPQAPAPYTALSQIRAVAGLCNAATFDATTMHLPLRSRRIIGDATDQAILRYSETLGEVFEVRDAWKTNFEMAFNSKNKFMLRTLVPVAGGGKDIALSKTEAMEFADGDSVLVIKGAPDVLLGRCESFVDGEGNVHVIDKAFVDGVTAIKDEWSKDGKRVILLARKVLRKGHVMSSPSDAKHEDEIMGLATHGLTLVGIVGIIDPLREEIPEVVRVLRGAGIRMFMVTGDYSLTAQAIATECGIITNPPSAIKSATALIRAPPNVSPSLEKYQPIAMSDKTTSIVISGPELMTLNDYQWDQLCLFDEIVFARTTPEQKLRIVREFQAKKNVLCMTGDGVNDAPSLKAADIGIALGSGSDIAIEAADMVLLDSFSAIVIALQYGRVVFDNLKKTIAYLLPAGSFSEFWPVFTSVCFGLPQVLSSFLMIVICCFTDCAAAIALAYEAPEADVLLRKPRVPGKDRLVDWKLIAHCYFFIGILQSLTSFFAAFWYLDRRGLGFSLFWWQYGALPEDVDADYVAQELKVASSIFFVNLVVMQFFNLLSVRTRRLSILQHPPVFRKSTQNWRLWPAIAFALVMIFFWLYIPEFWRVLGTAEVPVEYFFLPAGFGVAILLLDEARKWAVRRWPGSVVARCAW